MKNVSMSREGDILTIKVDMKQTFGKSASGKTTIIASTEGPASCPDSPDAVKLNLNLYTK